MSGSFAVCSGDLGAVATWQVAGARGGARRWRCGWSAGRPGRCGGPRGRPVMVRLPVVGHRAGDGERVALDRRGGSERRPRRPWRSGSRWSPRRGRPKPSDAVASPVSSGGPATSAPCPSQPSAPAGTGVSRSALPPRPRARPSLVVSSVGRPSDVRPGMVTMARCVEVLRTAPWSRSSADPGARARSGARRDTYPVLLCRMPTMTTLPVFRGSDRAEPGAAPRRQRAAAGLAGRRRPRPPLPSRPDSSSPWSAARSGTRCSGGSATTWTSPRTPAPSRS